MTPAPRLQKLPAQQWGTENSWPSKCEITILAWSYHTDESIRSPFLLYLKVCIGEVSLPSSIVTRQRLAGWLPLNMVLNGGPLSGPQCKQRLPQFLCIEKGINVGRRETYSDFSTTHIKSPANAHFNLLFLHKRTYYFIFHINSIIFILPYYTRCWLLIATEFNNMFDIADANRIIRWWYSWLPLKYIIHNITQRQKTHKLLIPKDTHGSRCTCFLLRAEVHDKSFLYVKGGHQLGLHFCFHIVAKPKFLIVRKALLQSDSICSFKCH